MPELCGEGLWQDCGAGWLPVAISVSPGFAEFETHPRWVAAAGIETEDRPIRSHKPHFQLPYSHCPLAVPSSRIPGLKTKVRKVSTTGSQHSAVLISNRHFVEAITFRRWSDNPNILWFLGLRAVLQFEIHRLGKRPEPPWFSLDPRISRANSPRSLVEAALMLTAVRVGVQPDDFANCIIDGRFFELLVNRLMQAPPSAASVDRNPCEAVPWHKHRITG